LQSVHADSYDIHGRRDADVSHRKMEARNDQQNHDFTFQNMNPSAKQVAPAPNHDMRTAALACFMESDAAKKARLWLLHNIPAARLARRWYRRLR
jgi:hypothetical protein